MEISAACGVRPVKAHKPRAVTVNGVEISRTAIAQEAQHHPAAEPAEAWIAAARALAIRELLLQQARNLGLEPSPASDAQGRRETDDEALVRAVIDHEVVVPEADDDVCRHYYHRNLRRFRSPAICEVSHILVAASPNDTGARRDAKRAAASLVTHLESAPEDFERLARAHSACPSREVGGNLGQLGPGQTVPELDAVLGSAPIGVVHADPVESRYGVHVILVSRRQEGRQIPYDMVRGQIAAYLEERVRRTAIRQYISLLVGASVVTGVDLASSPTPLVQ